LDFVSIPTRRDHTHCGDHTDQLLSREFPLDQITDLHFFVPS
jgi:hypothetical protein